MASSVYILDSRGTPLISRSYRGDAPIQISKIFHQHILETDNEFSISPVFEHDKFTFCTIHVGGVYLLAVSSLNVNTSLMISFLYNCVKVFKSYFKRVNEASIRDNFVLIYELLDEMMDHGYPQFTEEKTLKQYITQESYISNLFEVTAEEDLKPLPSAVAAAVGTARDAYPWRKPGLKYRKNEVFLDVFEKISVLVSASGETLFSEVTGTLLMRTKLSGMPTLKLGLSEKVQFDSYIGGDNNGVDITSKNSVYILPVPRGKTVDLEDVKFHQCVQLNRFEADRTISFVPPDGEFTLMTYRLGIKLQPLINVICNVVRHGARRVEICIKAKATYKRGCVANFVNISIPIPTDSDKPTAETSSGTAKYVPADGVLIWKIKGFKSACEYSCNCEYTLPSIRAADPTVESKRPIYVAFDIPYYTASGFQLRYLNVSERSNYDVMPWVRYMAQNGDYQIRTN